MDESKALLILKLRQLGVSNPEILDCIESIDRSHFVSKSFLDQCMEDIALPIDCGQTVSQPSLVGFMTQQLEIPKRSKVLEIGTGSGYQTACFPFFQSFNSSRRSRYFRESKFRSKRSLPTFNEFADMVLLSSEL